MYVELYTKKKRQGTRQLKNKHVANKPTRIAAGQHILRTNHSVPDFVDQYHPTEHTIKVDLI